MLVKAITQDGLVSDAATITVMVTEKAGSSDSSGTSSNSGLLSSATLASSSGNAKPVLHDTTFSVAENSAVGTVVGTLTTADDDSSSLLWFIIAGDDEGVFSMDSDSVVLNVSPDYETASSYTLTIRVRDAGKLYDTATVTVNITDVNEAPVITSPDDTLSVSEDAGTGTAIDTIVADDPDPDDVLSFKILSGNTGTAFSVNSSGILKVAGSLDYETTPEYTLLIQVSDGYLKDTVNLIVNVSDVYCDQSFDNTKYLCDTRDGQLYKYVIIGTQTWMAQNLNYGKNTTGNSYCYNDSSSYCDTYGRLYDWAATMAIATEYNDTTWGGDTVNHQGICPDGWHVPTYSEWDTLDAFVDQDNDGANDDDAGTSLKADTTLWSTNTGTDEYGFAALPGGYHGFNNLGELSIWWSSTEYSSDQISIYYIGSTSLQDVTNYGYDYKPYGFSLRCVKDTD